MVVGSNTGRCNEHVLQKLLHSARSETSFSVAIKSNLARFEIQLYIQSKPNKLLKVVLYLSKVLVPGFLRFLYPQQGWLTKNSTT